MPITTRLDLEIGATMRIEAAGGGGYGDPDDRKEEDRQRDQEWGYV
jgi:N-methylhydantoinase B/oxoprolinase/acetone carboxylase alpha subunit